ncbi:hypothetical protein NQ314_013299 [Rhamnusium bicolor]|uniref:von Hippel-Lindau disease tumour suppressor beta domain-containing protein n=1 Tax=Rhamnusium bicolor TaxID=1586634 RepID=A0AAV8X7A2_9CUCU|nr:hypothetical protein NQ314_013299 [Rhamnusium bicolor]
MLPRSLRSEEKAYVRFINKTDKMVELVWLNFNGEYVSREYLQERFPNKEIPENFETRIRAYITLPMYSLKYRTLMEIRNYFQNTEDVEQLELPKPLVDDLKRTIEFRNSQLEQDIQIHQ